jgi:hypothetical protein
MPIHLDPFDRGDIKFSAKHLAFGLVIGSLVVAVLYWLEPKSPAYEHCKEVAQTAYEECSNDASSQNDGPLNPSQKYCGLKLEQDLLACY